MKKKFHDLLGFSSCPRTVLPAGLWCMLFFFFLWCSCCRSRFPPAHFSHPSLVSSVQYFILHFRDTIPICWSERDCQSSGDVLSPTDHTNFFCLRENLGKKTKFECSLFLSYYFLASLCMKRPKSMPQWSKSCGRDCRPVKFKDFHWWSSKNLPNGNWISSHLCLGIAWWPYKLDIQQWESLSSATYTYFTLNCFFWVLFEMSLHPDLGRLVWIEIQYGWLIS